jgi:hypothetical protein
MRSLSFRAHQQLLHILLHVFVVALCIAEIGKLIGPVEAPIAFAQPVPTG